MAYRLCQPTAPGLSWRCSLALGGSGVCRLPDGFVVFCERALPGEELEAQITKAKRGHAFATKLKTLRQHDHAVRPLCAHFGPCGGCTLQSLSHSAQLAVKQAQVEEVMARIACLGNLGQVLRPIAPCGTLFHYRNKMEFSFSGRVWQPAANASTEAEDRQGSDYSKDFIFHAPTTALASQHPQPQRQSQRSPKTNTRQAEVLYNLVADAAGLRADCSDTVLDLYCGTGTIGLTLAGRCRRVVGVEVSAAAVADARRNAERNGIQNACFLQGDVGDVATGRVQLPSQPDVIITDPARAGMEPEVVAYLQSSGARTIVYVSCNPATQARDLAALSGQLDSRYAVHSIQPVDMFPHTAHVECIAVLQLRA
ncbi:hypothetical protein WJX72_008174 [[Myrmecia] bisecta]|uniref:TRAM domain-containing protein n=1 Tax=[Myrmecia] bisecta TaxID=41462 RepID=A0AAW1R8E1_9CHLO